MIYGTIIRHHKRNFLSVLVLLIVLLDGTMGFLPTQQCTSHLRKQYNLWQRHRKNHQLVHPHTDTTVRLNAVIDIVGVSPEPIHTAFAYATFGPQPFWLLLIFLPKAGITKKLMGKMGMSVCSACSMDEDLSSHFSSHSFCSTRCYHFLCLVTFLYCFSFYCATRGYSTPAGIQRCIRS